MSPDQGAALSPGPSPAEARRATLRLMETEREFRDVLRDQYTLGAEIGRGGMGIVYAAHDIKLDRRVAIKTLPPELADDPVVRERFVREGRMAARLEHPGIVTIHRADEIEGHAFFVMQYVAGPSLASLIAGAPHGLNPWAVTFLLMDVADALHYAHRQGVIHRDIKPENILIGPAGQAVVTDFGIARLEKADPLTNSGVVMGTVHYLSPEQIAVEELDGRSDVCSLGVVGYLALSGRLPFDGDAATAVVSARVSKPVPSLTAAAPHVPPDLAAVIERCLARDRASRYTNAEDLKWALAQVVGVRTQMEEARGAAARAGLAAASPEAGVAGVAGAAPAGPPRVSDSESHRILGRAAELDAITAGRPRPPIVALTRDDAADLARSWGHDVETMREAAIEAGIAPASVEQALAEHGLVPGGVRVSAREVDEATGPIGTKLRGGPSAVAYEIVVTGELDGAAHEAIARLLQRETGIEGDGRTVGREFLWRARSHGELRARVSSEGGQTTIRVGQKMRGALRVRVAAVVVVAVAAVFLGGVGLDYGASKHAMWGMVVCAAGAAWWGTRWVYRRVSRRRGARVRLLAEAVALVARG